MAQLNWFHECTAPSLSDNSPFHAPHNDLRAAIPQYHAAIYINTIIASEVNMQHSMRQTMRATLAQHLATPHAGSSQVSDRFADKSLRLFFLAFLLVASFSLRKDGSLRWEWTVLWLIKNWHSACSFLLMDARSLSMGLFETIPSKIQKDVAIYIFFYFSFL